MVTKYKIWLAVLLLWSSTHSLVAQSFEYLLKPTLSEIDDLHFDPASAKLGLFAVRIKDKWGVKNAEDVLVVPIMYDSLRIDTEAGMITCFQQKTVSNLNYKGRKFSYLEVDSLFQNRDRKRWLGLAKKLQQQCKEALPGFVLNYTQKSLPEVTLVDPSGKTIDSIRLQNHTQVYHSASGYVFINGSMYNKKGENLSPTISTVSSYPAAQDLSWPNKQDFGAYSMPTANPCCPVYIPASTLSKACPFFFWVAIINTI